MVKITELLPMVREEVFKVGTDELGWKAPGLINIWREHTGRRNMLVKVVKCISNIHNIKNITHAWVHHVDFLGRTSLPL